MRGKKLVAPAVIIAFLLVLYIPVFIWLVRAWLANPYYGHGFLVLPISAFIIWWRRKELVKGEPVPLGILPLALGLALYVWGFLWRIRPLCAFSLLPVLLGLTLYFRGKNCARTLAFPICFLVFMIPLPFLDGLLPFLQSFTTRWSAAIVGAMGIPVAVTGAQIHLPHSTFLIGLPCSGMSTLISLLALAALLAYILRGRTYKRVILFLLAFPIAILANLVRIVSLLLIGNHWGGEVAMAYFHDYSSLVFYLVALLLLGLIARVLGCHIPLPRKA